MTKPRPTNRARKRPQQYGKPAPGIALEDAALARVASRAPRCGLHAACVPTRASQSRSVQAPPYHHLDRRSSPPDNDAAAKAFSGLLVTPRTPSGLVLSLSLLLVYFHVWVWPSLCPATWLAHHRKNKTENKNLMVFTEEDWIQKTRRGSPRICWRSRRWLIRGVPGGRRQRRRTPTHFGCLYRQTTTSALQRCAPAAREELLLPPRASVLPRVRARCERRRSRLLTHPLQKAEYEPRRDDSFRAVEEVLTNATAAKVCTCFGRCARERKFARRCLAARMRGCRGAHQAYAVPCTPNECCIVHSRIFCCSAATSFTKTGPRGSAWSRQ